MSRVDLLQPSRLPIRFPMATYRTIFKALAVVVRLPLWVKSRHPAEGRFMSAIGGKADIQCPLSGADANSRR